MTKNLSHDNWFTPIEVIEPVRQFYDGLIDIDLATCFEANKTIRAWNYYTINAQLPPDRVFHSTNMWCNPPYCNGVVQGWVDRACELAGNDNQIIMLVNRSDAKWYYNFLDNHQGAYYQFRNRIKFIDGATGKKSSPRYNNDLIYWGNNFAKFRDMCLESFGKPSPCSFY
jgi:hypothetical protein